MLLFTLTPLGGVFGMTTIGGLPWAICVGLALAAVVGDEYVKAHFRARSETKQRFRKVQDNFDHVMTGLQALHWQIMRLETQLTSDKDSMRRLQRVQSTTGMHRRKVSAWLDRPPGPAASAEAVTRSTARAAVRASPAPMPMTPAASAHARVASVDMDTLSVPLSGDISLSGRE